MGNQCCVFKAPTFYVCNPLGLWPQCFPSLCLLGFPAKHPGIRWSGVFLGGIAPAYFPKMRPVWWWGLVRRTRYWTRGNSCPFKCHKSQHGGHSAPVAFGVMMQTFPSSFCLKICFIARQLKEREIADASCPGLRHQGGGF